MAVSRGRRCAAQLRFAADAALASARPAQLKPGTLDRQVNPRVMYIELKVGGVRGSARIGRVEFSQTGKTLYYAGRKRAPLKGQGLKANYFDSETLEKFWISGPRADGTDSLYGATQPGVEPDGRLRGRRLTPYR